VPLPKEAAGAGPVERAAGAREPPGAQAVAQGVGAAAQARGARQPA
jgi:hypothetical protein